MMDEGYMRVKQVSDRIGMSEGLGPPLFRRDRGCSQGQIPGETLQTSLYNSADSYGNRRAGTKKDVCLSAERQQSESFRSLLFRPSVAGQLFGVPALCDRLIERLL